MRGVSPEALSAASRIGAGVGLGVEGLGFLLGLEVSIFWLIRFRVRKLRVDRVLGSKTLKARVAWWSKGKDSADQP